MVTREQLENAVEESVVNGTPTGMFIINFEKLVDIEKYVHSSYMLYSMQ